MTFMKTSLFSCLIPGFSFFQIVLNIYIKKNVFVLGGFVYITNNSKRKTCPEINFAIDELIQDTFKCSSEFTAPSSNQHIETSAINSDRWL